MTKKILIVEDDPFTQHFYKYFFAKTSYQTIITENGDEIINTLINKKISLLILDINLKNTYLNKKKTDGVEIARYIRDNNKIAPVPIILVTAYQEKIGNAKAFNRAIADDYILKPLSDFDELLYKIEKNIA